MSEPRIEAAVRALIISTVVGNDEDALIAAQRELLEAAVAIGPDFEKLLIAAAVEKFAQVLPNISHDKIRAAVKIDYDRAIGKLIRLATIESEGSA